MRFPDEDTLDMCCPYLTSDLPKSFTGPGFVRMDRVILCRRSAGSNNRVGSD